MRIVFTPPALQQTDSVLTYIETRNPQGAARIRAQLQSHIAILADHPFAGHKTSKPGQRRIIARPYSYAIFYGFTDDAVIIQRVRHTAQRPT